MPPGREQLRQVLPLYALASMDAATRLRAVFFTACPCIGGAWAAVSTGGLTVQLLEICSVGTFLPRAIRPHSPAPEA